MFKVVERARVHAKGEVFNCDHKFFKQFGIMGLDWLYLLIIATYW